MTSTPLQKPSSSPIRLKIDEFCAYQIYNDKNCSLSCKVSGYDNGMVTSLSRNVNGFSDSFV